MEGKPEKLAIDGGLRVCVLFPAMPPFLSFCVGGEKC